VRVKLEQSERINKFTSNRSKSHLNKTFAGMKKAAERQKLPTLIKAKRRKKPKRQKLFQSTHEKRRKKCENLCYFRAVVI
jgi:hypothetical protein